MGGLVSRSRSRGAGKGTALDPRRYEEIDLGADIATERIRSEEFRRTFDALRDATIVARQLHRLRVRRGLTQSQLARIVGTSQQVISRLERPGYDGHSLSMLRRVVSALEGRLVVEIASM